MNARNPIAHINPDELLLVQKPFLEIARKYRLDVTKLVSKDGVSPLGKVLKRIDARVELNNSEIHLLEQSEEFRVLATYYYIRFTRFLNAWDLAKASKFLQKAGMTEKAIEITEKFLERTILNSEADSAVYTSRGAALRHQSRLQEARTCGEVACKLSPHSYHPYNLLGGICFDEQSIEEGNAYFDKAVELGSPLYIRENEKKKMDALKKYILKAKAFGGPGSGVSSTDKKVE